MTAAEPTGVKRYRAVIEFDCDHDNQLGGFISTWPEDWHWEHVLHNGVHSVGYVKLVSAREIGEEE